jgi:hypothetical protein
MASFYKSSVQEFLAQAPATVLAQLATSYANRGYTSQYSDQTLTWEHDLLSLRETLTDCVSVSQSAFGWGLILEFSIPRKEFRIDAVLLIGDVVAILETKSSAADGQAKRQIEQYALLLHYFHKASDQRKIVPILVSPQGGPPEWIRLRQQELFPQIAAYWIAPVMRSDWLSLADVLSAIEPSTLQQISVEDWEGSAYNPVPSIMEAAVALQSGLSIKDIAHCEASEHEIDDVRNTIQSCISRAREDHRHTICFLTGVPGSGKTLVGLSLAHSAQNQTDAVHFMSGNGPLVKVLQHLFKAESRRRGSPAPQAEAEAKTLIENVHVFARYYADDNPGAPSNHAIIFDEAQRAWNRKQNLKKFKRNYSEPEMLLEIMERLSDWAVIVALVGGGQEINDGEAGLEEWGRALVQRPKIWDIYASPEVVEGGQSTAGHRLFEDPATRKNIVASTALHLRTSNRSLRAEKLATWVNLLLEGDSDKAASIGITKRFPIFLSRDLGATRRKLREQRLGGTRYGLVGSSGATRLRAEGLEPTGVFHAGYPWEHWYLSPETDVRSSFRCEVFATEFEIQGLELDWIGMCWGGDFVWNDGTQWQLRALRYGEHTRWTNIKNSEKQSYRRNAYRVLLTRARQGMVIYVPTGDADDPTNRPDEFDATASYLIRCGVISLG